MERRVQVVKRKCRLGTAPLPSELLLLVRARGESIALKLLKIRAREIRDGAENSINQRGMEVKGGKDEHQKKKSSDARGENRVQRWMQIVGKVWGGM